MAYDAVSDLLSDAGVEVEMLSDEEMRRKAEESEGRFQFMVSQIEKRQYQSRLVTKSQTRRQRTNQ